MDESDKKNMVKKVEQIALKSSYSYHDNIERVFDFWTNTKKYITVLQDMLSEVVFEKGKDFSDLGAKIHMKWKNSIACEMEIVEVVNTNYFKRINAEVWQISPFKVYYEIVYDFYWNSLECETLFVSEIKFFDPEIKDVIARQYNQDEKTVLMKKFEDYLKKNIDDLIQEESIQIETNINNVWNVITDWNKFKEYSSSSVGGKITYEGEALEVNTKMHVYNESEGSEYHLKVILVEILKDQRTYGMNFYAGVPKSPKQDVIFILHEINENSCIVKLRHEFKQYVKAKRINKIMIEKRNTLKKMKIKLETENKK